MCYAVAREMPVEKKIDEQLDRLIFQVSESAEQLARIANFLEAISFSLQNISDTLQLKE